MKLKIQLPYNPAIPLQKTMKILIQKDTYIHMFIAAMFVIYNSQDMEATQMPISRQLA